jgi:5-methylcytosine-specific restriction endonuclease McrA
MIRIPVTPEELTRLIEEEAPGWSKRAAERTKQARRLERFTGPGIWSEVKGVYMRLQHHKCAYCERPMAESPEAKLEYDVEHFRPKSRVTPWPDEDTAKRLRIRYKVRSGAARGYPLLAHDPRNYAVTCKVCNSPLKADHFPIDGRPVHSGSDITKLDAREKPLLLFPLGAEGPAPEELLTFKGIVPVPAKRGGYARKRARVSIDFFRLHLRGELNTGRAHCLVLLSGTSSSWREWERPDNAAMRKRSSSALDRSISLSRGVPEPSWTSMHATPRQRRPITARRMRWWLARSPVCMGRLWEAMSRACNEWTEGGAKTWKVR